MITGNWLINYYLCVGKFCFFGESFCLSDNATRIVAHLVLLAYIFVFYKLAIKIYNKRKNNTQQNISRASGEKPIEKTNVGEMKESTSSSVEIYNTK